MADQNDYRFMLDVLANRRPARLPIYEHLIDIPIMERILNARFADLIHGGPGEVEEFFRLYCRFYQEMGYDTVSFECCVTSILPETGAIYGGRPGPIQTRADFERFPWQDLPRIYWERFTAQFEALARAMPPGMQGVGGVGNGVFEISEDLVGFERLPLMMADDPELFAALYAKIGDLLANIWSQFLPRFGHLYAVCRMGDDLGFRTSTLFSPRWLRAHIFPQYRRVIGQVKAAGKPFLWHSCGNIFGVMEDVIALGIDAKHSNEDAIAPFETWIARYGDRIGLLGGIDVDILCQQSPAEVQATVIERGSRYRALAKGYALGSGNSIPHYVPVENYLAMVEAARKLN